MGGLFNDEQYFRKPEEYRPERFDDDEKHKNHDSIFIPFGDGPRICIGGIEIVIIVGQYRSIVTNFIYFIFSGNRFALMNAKLCLVHLLKHYDFETTSATVYPIAFEPNVFFTKLNHPILLKCNPRSAHVK